MGKGKHLHVSTQEQTNKPLVVRTHTRTSARHHHRRRRRRGVSRKRHYWVLFLGRLFFFVFLSLLPFSLFLTQKHLHFDCCSFCPLVCVDLDHCVFTCLFIYINLTKKK